MYFRLHLPVASLELFGELSVCSWLVPANAGASWSLTLRRCPVPIRSLPTTSRLWLKPSVLRPCRTTGDCLRFRQRQNDWRLSEVKHLSSNLHGASSCPSCTNCVFPISCPANITPLHMASHHPRFITPPGLTPWIVRRGATPTLLRHTFHCFRGSTTIDLCAEKASGEYKWAVGWVYESSDLVCRVIVNERVSQKDHDHHHLMVS